MENRPIPPVPKELMSALEDTFPERRPSLNDTDRQIWRRVGHCEVVDKVREWYEEQHEQF